MSIDNRVAIPKIDTAKIDALAARIQALPLDIRWAAADEAIIAAVASGAKGTEGPVSRRVRALLERASRVGLAYPLVRVLSFVQLLRLWLRQRRAVGGRHSVRTNSGRLFIGIRALKEKELRPHYEARVGGPAAYVDQREELCLCEIARPTWWALQAAWRDAGHTALAALRFGRIPLPEASVLTSLARRWHAYAYFLACFREIGAAVLKGPIGFSTADLSAYAAVAAGLDAVYYQHGFLRRSLVFPDFVEVVGFNAPEIAHLTERLPRTVACLVSPRLEDWVPARRLVVVGDYIEREALPTRELIEACRAKGIDIVVRPHPADKVEHWRAWGDADGVWVDHEGTFSEFLARHRPAVVATWFSTAMFEAALMGAVPVTLAAEAADIVFPFHRLALRWPSERARILRVFDDPETRVGALASARSVAIGAPA